MNDREQVKVKNGEHDVDAGVAMITPSVNDVGIESPDAEVSKSVCQNVSVSVSTSINCMITDGKCINGCEIKMIKVSSRKRVQNKKTKLWYDRTMKITKPICVRQRTGSGPGGSENG